ncbi:MAG TPA: VWA domain-containing protein [Dehalococcoidales bacterium]|nr:VWA domain-containing protein [Dehalococcoidales bacterium]
MDELSRRLMADGNLSEALWRMQNSRLRDKHNRQLPSLKEMLRRLQERKQNQLKRFSLDSIMDDIGKELEDILQTERAGISKKTEEIEQKAQKASQGSGELSPETIQKMVQVAKEKAAHNLEKLDNLPQDIGGKVKELNKYDFMDEEARRKFKELIEKLKKRTMDTYAREISQNIKNLDPAALAEMREMLKALNRMLEQRLRGEEPDFDQFMQRFGHFFGPDPPKDLDELMQRLQQQIAQAQSLLNSLSEEQRKSLLEMMDSMLDKATRDEMDKLSSNLQALDPDFFPGIQYQFSGDEALSFDEAMKLMEQMHKMDKLEDQITGSQFDQSPENIDRELVSELLGEPSAEDLDAINSITKLLEEAGYIRREDQKFALTPRGMRKIGEKALSSVFSRLKKDRLGQHNIKQRGSGGDRIDETKKYEFGDDFDLHIEKTISNALLRKAQIPVKLDPADFEVFREEQTTRSATVLMLDMSLSMRMGGNFEAAKIVSMALNSLISSKFPKDSLHILGFNSVARRMTTEELAYIGWQDFSPHTNMQHGFILARKLMEKDRSANKQIILISDGQPTAHIENGQVYFQIPTSRRCFELTLKEVKNCTRIGIEINTFMLPSHDYSNFFVDRMSRINHGRVFFTAPGELGKYLIVDYLDHKKSRVQ